MKRWHFYVRLLFLTCTEWKILNSRNLIYLKMFPKGVLNPKTNLDFILIYRLKLTKNVGGQFMYLEISPNKCNNLPLTWFKI